MTKKLDKQGNRLDVHYDSILGDISNVIDVALRSAARSVNSIITAAYWLIGRRIVEFEQAGEKRAEYGTALIERLVADLTQRFGRGFSRQNIQQMRLFYLFSQPSGFARHCLANWCKPYGNRYARRCLENPRHRLRNLTSDNLSRPFRSRGPHMCACSP